MLLSTHSKKTVTHILFALLPVFLLGFGIVVVAQTGQQTTQYNTNHCKYQDGNYEKHKCLYLDKKGAEDGSLKVDQGSANGDTREGEKSVKFINNGDTQLFIPTGSERELGAFLRVADNFGVRRCVDNVATNESVKADAHDGLQGAIAAEQGISGCGDLEWTCQEGTPNSCSGSWTTTTVSSCSGIPTGGTGDCVKVGYSHVDPMELPFFTEMGGNVCASISNQSTCNSPTYQHVSHLNTYYHCQWHGGNSSGSCSDLGSSAACSSQQGCNWRQGGTITSLCLDAVSEFACTSQNRNCSWSGGSSAEVACKDNLISTGSKILGSDELCVNELGDKPDVATQCGGTSGYSWCTETTLTGTCNGTATAATGDPRDWNLTYFDWDPAYVYKPDRGVLAHCHEMNEINPQYDITTCLQGTQAGTYSGLAYVVEAWNVGPSAYWSMLTLQNGIVTSVERPAVPAYSGGGSQGLCSDNTTSSSCGAVTGCSWNSSGGVVSRCKRDSDGQLQHGDGNCSSPTPDPIFLPSCTNDSLLDLACGTTQNTCLNPYLYSAGGGVNEWYCSLSGGALPTELVHLCDASPVLTATNGECKVYPDFHTSQPATNSSTGCDVGTYVDASDNLTLYKWACIGSNGGSTDNCAAQKQDNGGGLGCFIKNTQITMVDGTYKNIEDVLIGDILKGETTNNTVLGYHRPKLENKLLYGYNGGTAFATADHPFKTTEGWKAFNPSQAMKEHNLDIEIGQLELGDILITEKGFEELTSFDTKKDVPETQLYNFIVDGDNTYYADGYLVHNKKLE